MARWASSKLVPRVSLLLAPCSGKESDPGKEVS